MAHIIRLDTDISIEPIGMPSGEIPFKWFTKFDGVEIVRAEGLKAWNDARADNARLVLVVDEEGTFKGDVRTNFYASTLYGVWKHGKTIVGEAYIVIEHLVDTDEGPDWVLRSIEPEDNVLVDLIREYIVTAVLFPLGVPSEE